MDSGQNDTHWSNQGDQAVRSGKENLPRFYSNVSICIALNLPVTTDKSVAAASYWKILGGSEDGTGDHRR
jgi:hypothetical protein